MRDQDEELVRELTETLPWQYDLVDIRKALNEAITRTRRETLLEAAEIYQHSPLHWTVGEQLRKMADEPRKEDHVRTDSSTDRTS